MSTRTLMSRALTVGLLLLGAAVILLPFIWMLSLSVKPADEIFQRGFQLIPSRFEWQNYTEAFTEVPIFRFLLNGFIVCTGILVFQMKHV